MEIISRGTLPSEQKFKGTCGNCKSVFTCLRHEGQYSVGTQRDGEFISVTCPVCSSTAFAYPRNDGAQIPLHWRTQADSTVTNDR